MTKSPITVRLERNVRRVKESNLNHHRLKAVDSVCAPEGA
jgi:hypothetical protein